MSKTYADYTTEILADDLYEGLLAHGLFSEKIPPILSSESFFEYCKKETPHFSDKWRQFITFESMRNINIPRVLGIPNPMSYQQLCKCLSNSWENIKNHFANKTQDQDYVISRIHIRKLKQKDALFSMSYSNWKEDETPEPDLLIGSTYLVKADISTCFPSIYTHSVPWALVGKATAKANSGNKFKNEWYNIGMQDYLPTWRWWFTANFMGRDVTDVPSKGLKAEFTWDDAWFGGSCLSIAGQTDREYLHLFKTQYSLKSGDVLTIRYKVVSGTGSVAVACSAEGKEGT